ncbi:MAG TPA: tetratricopeptide repeat protein, partial [Planctomycetota bacterium]|nr:tetratricopeptide repeat protein [Planctomycetota bacterium]
IHVFGKDAEAFEILSKLNDALLVPPHEPVLRQIYMADASAGMGKREDAQKRLESLRPIVNLADRAYAIGRRSRLLAVQTYIRRGEYEAAQKELRNIEWETPVERLSDETGMLRAECYIADNDFQHAIVLLNRLIKVNKESARMPEMLFTLMKAYRGAKQTEQMQETFSKLKKEHPYAQETALGAMMVK